MTTRQHQSSLFVMVNKILVCKETVVLRNSTFIDSFDKTKIFVNYNGATWFFVGFLYEDNDCSELLQSEGDVFLFAVLSTFMKRSVNRSIGYGNCASIFWR